MRRRHTLTDHPVHSISLHSIFLEIVNEGSRAANVSRKDWILSCLAPSSKGVHEADFRPNVEYLRGALPSIADEIPSDPKCEKLSGQAKLDMVSKVYSRPLP